MSNSTTVDSNAIPPSNLAAAISIGVAVVGIFLLVLSITIFAGIIKMIVDKVKKKKATEHMEKIPDSSTTTGTTALSVTTPDKM